MLVNDEFVFLKKLGLGIINHRKSIEVELSTKNINVNGANYQSEIRSIMNQALISFSPSAVGKKVHSIESYLESKKEIIPSHLMSLFNNFIRNILDIVKHIEKIKFDSIGTIIELADMIDNYSNLEIQIKNYKLGIIESKELLSNKIEISEKEDILQISFFSGINNFQIHVCVAQMIDFCYNSLCQAFKMDYNKKSS